jgi:hypothetical protein
MTYSDSTFVIEVNQVPYAVFQTKWQSDAEAFGKRWAADYAELLTAKGTHGTELPPVIKVRIARPSEKAVFADDNSPELYEGLRIVFLPRPADMRA